MQINVAQLIKEPVGSTRSYRIDNNVSDEVVDSVKGDLTLTRTNRSVLVTGTLTASARGTCDRCLEEARCTYNYKLEEEFFPKMDISNGLVSSTEYDDSNTIGDNNILELTDVIHQYTMLSVPVKLLCGQECAGLCPYCGHNLNRGKCRCSSSSRAKFSPKLVSFKKGE